MNKKSIRMIGILLIFVLGFTLLSGCVKESNPNDAQDIDESQNVEENGNNYPMEVTDAFGNTVTLEKQPTRIISLAPSHTEILYSLGLDDKIVGVTTYCDYPEEAKSKEKVGDAMAVNVERVIELNPDLVIQYGPGNEDTNNKIKDAGIPILSYEPESIDEVIELINEIGKITGTGRAATILTTDMMAKRDYIITKVQNVEKPKVFYEIWNEPLMAAGPGSFIDELINLAGGENIANDAKGEYPEFELEQLIERNPDVYLSSKDFEEKTIESIKSREGYDSINAIKNDRVYLLEPNITSRPGPRIVEGLELIAKAIHPELFE